MLKAQELGKLNLDDPINKYLAFDVSNPSFPKESITLRHLANHSSSINDTKFYDDNVYVLKDNRGFNGIEEMKDVFKPAATQLSMSKFLEKLLSKDGDWYLKEGFTEFKPGTHYNYTNVGAALAAYIVEQATGKSYPKFTKKYIFDPLKMAASGWSFETVDTSLVSKLYYNDKAIPSYRLQSYPDGGLFTSAHDLSLLLKELINGQSGVSVLLTTESYREIFGPKTIAHPTMNQKKENPALSVQYDSCIFMGKTDTGYFGHTGGDLGLVSLMFFNGQDGLGRILTVNTHIDGAEEKTLNQLWNIWNTLELHKTKLNDSKTNNEQ